MNKQKVHTFAKLKTLRSENMFPERGKHVHFGNCQNMSVVIEGESVEMRESFCPKGTASPHAERNEESCIENCEKLQMVNVNMPPEDHEIAQTEQRKVSSEKRYFCCGSLADGAVASANYTYVICVIILLSSCHEFFQSAGEEEEGTVKTISFGAFIYAVIYIHTCKNLKRAINDEQRDDLLPWVCFSTLTTFFLLSGAIYTVVNYWDNLDDFQEDLATPCLLLILIAFLTFVACTLIYCIYGVMRLYKSMDTSRNGGHTLMDGMRAFANGVAV